MFDLLSTCGTSDAVKKCRQQCKYFEADTVRIDFCKIVESIWGPATGEAGDAQGLARFEKEMRRSRQEHDEWKSLSRKSGDVLEHDFPLQVSRQHSTHPCHRHDAQDGPAEPSQASRHSSRVQHEGEEPRLEPAHSSREQRRREEREEERGRQMGDEMRHEQEERRRRAQEVQAALLAEQRRREEQEAERRRGEEEQKKRLEEVRAALAAEQTLQEETARSKGHRMCFQALDQVSKREKLRLFLEAGGFRAVNDKRQQMASLKATSFASMAPQFSYPLHAAVRAKDPAAVEALIWGGAEPALQDSQKLTPLALAEKLNKKDSHAGVIAALSGI